VTTASLLIAKFMKENFPAIDVRASVNMDIGTVEGLEYVEGYFDSFYVRRDLNRNMPELLKLKRWCDGRDKTMYLLANSGCLNNCSAHVFHDNLVAHEAESAEMDNGYSFTGVCHEYLSKLENHSSWLERTGFIRPEDVGEYEGVVEAMKLATRVNSSPSRILDAYVGASYRGAVTELLEPDHTGAFYPKYIDNSRFPKEYSAKVLYCNKKCSECDYCKSTLEAATVKLISDPSIKV
jgi:collagenase-like PrtC family protease